MATQRKKIETFTVALETEGSFSFSEIITNPNIVEREHVIKRKNISLRILDKGTDVIIGLIETSRNDGIPPKKNRKKKKILPLGLDPDEGLAYANIFLYEKKRKILMYEVNKFGCFVDHFLEYLYKCCEDRTSISLPFNINISPLLNADAYRSILKMDYYKSIELEISNPKQVIADYKHQNDALLSLCNTASEFGSTKVSAKFAVEARRKTMGLSSTSLKAILKRVVPILGSPNGNNIRKVVVTGYESDSDDDRLQPIDLIADRYLKHIELDEPREGVNLLEHQRHTRIKDLYTNCLSDFDAIFGK